MDVKAVLRTLAHKRSAIPIGLRSGLCKQAHDMDRAFRRKESPALKHKFERLVYRNMALVKSHANFACCLSPLRPDFPRQIDGTPLELHKWQDYVASPQLISND
jgi:hypothetical protein